MAATTTPLITVLYLCSHMTAEDILAPLCTVQEPAPQTESAQNLSTNSGDLDELQGATSQKRGPRIHYSFGKTAAQSSNDAVAKGFFKNENPHKPGEPLLKSLEVGHCVMVPRSDGSLSYGIITEILQPHLVCVACDRNPRNRDDLAIKIMPSANLFLDPAWLNNFLKDGATLAHHYNYACSGMHERPPEPTPYAQR